jgi:3-dehydroquinate dehydratase II
MDKTILVLNGPNLNRLGTREPHIYGTTTLQDIEKMCREAAPGVTVDFRQTNHEGELIEWIHDAIGTAAAIVINPAAWSFTSLALLDALKMFPGPIVEVHISNIHRREAHYHHSYVSLAATAVIAGLGAEGYPAAVTAAAALVAAQPR